MMLKAFPKFSAARRLLGSRTFSSEEERLKGLLLLAMLLASLPMPLVDFFLILTATGRVTIIPPIAAAVLVGLIGGMRRGLDLRAVTVLFGLSMEAVFIHGVLRLGSPSMIIGLVLTPFISVLTGGWKASSVLLAAPFAFILVMPRLLTRMPDLRGPLAALFSDAPSLESVNFFVLLGLVFLAACTLESVIHNLFTAYEAEKDATLKEMAARKEKERLLQTIFRTVPVPLFVKDAELRYTFCSDTFCDFIASPPTAVLGRKMEDLFEVELQRSLGEADRRMQETGLAQRFSASLTRAGGEDLSITVVKVPLTDETGKFMGIVGAFLDETARYQQERKLQALLEANRSSLALLGHDLKNPIGSFRNLVRSMRQDDCVEPEEFHEVLAEMGTSLDTLYRLLEELLDWAKAMRR